MGADMISMMFVGPTKLVVSEKKAKAQVAKAMKRIRACQKWNGGKLPEGLDYEEDVESVGLYTEREVRDILQDFISFWNNPGTRDSAWREARVGTKRVRIVTAGGMSWGDEPDGAGYSLMKQVEQLGLAVGLGFY